MYRSSIRWTKSCFNSLEYKFDRKIWFSSEFNKIFNIRNVALKHFVLEPADFLVAAFQKMIQSSWYKDMDILSELDIAYFVQKYHQFCKFSAEKCNCQALHEQNLNNPENVCKYEMSSWRCHWIMRLLSVHKIWCHLSFLL